MRTVHFLSIGAAVLLVALLYFAVPTVPPKGSGNVAPSGQHQGNGPMQGGNAPVIAAASTADVLRAAREAVGTHGLLEIKKVEDSLSQSGVDSMRMIPGFAHLARLWASHRQGSAAGYYLALESMLEKSPEKLTFAGRFFLNLVSSQAQDSPSVRMWNAQQAVALFQKAQTLAPADSTQIDLATAYIEGTGETMQGVQLLLGIVRKDPDNIPALLSLGRLAIQSEQWDKAIDRFGNVLRLQPQNTEALYFLAEAYKGQGDRAKAVEYFERAKKAVHNPEFSRDVDAYLKTF